MIYSVVAFQLTRFIRIIGLETFKGSFRRTCYLQPVLGEDEIQFEEQFCGGHIDPDTLEPVGFLKADGTTGRRKGFICPLGQICKEGENPNSGTANFDTIYYSLLQIVIVGSANGVSTLATFYIGILPFNDCTSVDAGHVPGH
jgi:voltage-dependent calcium channel